jgi:hypothetical protein
VSQLTLTAINTYCCCAYVLTHLQVIAAFDMMQLPVPTAEVWAPYEAAEELFAVEEAKLCKEYEATEQNRYHEQQRSAAGEGGASSATSTSTSDSDEGLSEAEVLEVAALVTPGFGDVDSDFADVDAAATDSADSSSSDSSARSVPPAAAATTAAVLSSEPTSAAVAVALVSIDSAVIGSSVDGDTSTITAADNEQGTEDEIDEAEFQRRWYGVA